MKIKQLIEDQGISIAFHIDETGSLVIDINSEMDISIPNSTAMELVEFLRNKLIDHHNANSSIFKNLFQ